MHPFDIQAALFAKHAQHVVLIHFPIALFIVGVAFDFAAQWTSKKSLSDAAYYNIVIAALSTLPVVATGLLAWQFQLEGEKLKGVLLLHLIFGTLAAAMIWLAWFLHYRARRRALSLPSYRLPIELLGAAIVALTGHLGGFLSGVNIMR
jgi:uncharacterized membrane protein